MLTHVRIKNFKAWQDTGETRLAPLTVVFGTNSSGKSSLGHLLLALKQTVLSTDRKRALHLGDKSTFVDLGTFDDCIYGHENLLCFAESKAGQAPRSLTQIKPGTTRCGSLRWAPLRTGEMEGVKE